MQVIVEQKVEDRPLHNSKIFGFESKYVNLLRHGPIQNAPVHSFGGQLVAIRVKSLNGATDVQKRCAMDLKMSKRGRGCIIPLDRPELVGKARKIQHLLAISTVPFSMPSGRFKINVEDNVMTTRYENFSDNNKQGESIIVDDSEYVIVESRDGEFGATWSTSVGVDGALESINSLSKLFPSDSGDQSSSIIVEEPDGSSWPVDASIPEISEFAAESPEQIFAIFVKSGANQIQWARPARRIRTAQVDSAEFGVRARLDDIHNITRALAFTATKGIVANPRKITDRIIQTKSYK